MYGMFGTRRTGRRRGVDTRNSQLNMTPMIDIIFQLLIFFMVGAKLRAAEGHIPSYLPKDHGQGIALASVVELQEVRVKLLFRLPDGTFADPARHIDPDLPGEVVLEVGEQVFETILASGERAPDYARLARYLAERAARYEGPAEDGLPVIIDARRQVPVQHVVSALNACIEAGIRNVEIAEPEHAY